MFTTLIEFFRAIWTLLDEDPEADTLEAMTANPPAKRAPKASA